MASIKWWGCRDGDGSRSVREEKSTGRRGRGLPVCVCVRTAVIAWQLQGHLTCVTAAARVCHLCFTARLRRSPPVCVQACVRVCLILSHSCLLCVSLVRSLRTPIWLPELTVSRCAHRSGSWSQLRKVSSVGSTHICLQHAGAILNIYGKCLFG